MKAIAVVTMIFLPSTFVAVSNYVRKLIPDESLLITAVSVDLLQHVFLPLRPAQHYRKWEPFRLSFFLDILGGIDPSILADFPRLAVMGRKKP